MCLVLVVAFENEAAMTSCLRYRRTHHTQSGYSSQTTPLPHRHLPSHVFLILFPQFSNYLSHANLLHAMLRNDYHCLLKCDTNFLNISPQQIKTILARDTGQLRHSCKAF